MNKYNLPKSKKEKKELLSSIMAGKKSIADIMHVAPKVVLWQSLGSNLIKNNIGETIATGDYNERLLNGKKGEMHIKVVSMGVPLAFRETDVEQNINVQPFIL